MAPRAVIETLADGPSSGNLCRVAGQPEQVVFLDYRGVAKMLDEIFILSQAKFVCERYI